MIIEIADHRDRRLDAYRSLTDRALQHDRRGFIGESPLVVERMLSVPDLTESLLVDQRRASWAAHRAPPDVPVYVADRAILAAVTGYSVHRGVLAVGRRPASQVPLAALPLPESGSCVVLVIEGISDPENVGLLFRTAAALAVNAVVLSPDAHDPLYRRALRVAMGHTLRLPWARSESWPTDLGLLRNQGLTILGAATGSGAVPVANCRRPSRAALVVGSEASGLSPAVRAECDQLIRVPMALGIDSLNVAVAAAIVLDLLATDGRT